jgi:hypothetical protein
MIRSTIAVLISLSIGVSSGCVTKSPDHNRSGRFDLDQDGYLTPEEYSASKLSEVLAFEELDTDADGLLSTEELGLPLAGGRGAGGERTGEGGRRDRGGRDRT